MDYQFRSALNGFNRSDVVVYLQNMTERYKSMLLDVQTKANAAAEEAEGLRKENEALRAKLDELQQDDNLKAPVAPAMQQEELEAYRRAAAKEQEAADKLAEVETLVAERLAAADQESEEKLIKARETLSRIQEQVNAMTAFLNEAATSLEEL